MNKDVMTPQKHKNGSSGAALMPPRHQTHADSLPEHTSAAASTPVGVLQYLHEGVSKLAHPLFSFLH